MPTQVPDRGDHPNRRINVGKYTIEYGANPFTGHPEAWAESNKTGLSHAATMHDTGEILHGSRGTNPVPDKYAQKHIDRTLRQMKKGK